MPRRTDIDSILIPGSGPIVIGQACEFDYSGTQACRALRQEGYRTILLNSNPATIMTDPDLADATYVEPMTPEILIQILDKEKPSAILATVGGQTSLNLVMELYKAGEIQKRGIILLGASAESIEKAESRSLFKEAMIKLGYKVPESALCSSLEDAKEFHNRMGLPLVIRPSFTLGGTGGGIVFTEEEFNDMCQAGLDASLTHQILVEQSVLGWKEIELEIIRDRVDTSIIICSIENLDPMGVHTGDSIAIAPQQTLTDQEYQELRNASIAIMREIGLNSGGSNIQFAVNPANGEWVVIEMNPRVSRSSALASKATGFPIASVSALLSVGYTLDEIPNRMTKTTFASFEPTIDYVVTKVPRFTFEKFPGSKPVLGSMMKSVGETMAIGRTFQTSFQKAFRSLEIGRFGYGVDGNLDELFKIESHKAANTLVSYLETSLRVPNPERIFDVKTAIELDKQGILKFPLEKIYELSKIDYWFLYQFEDWVNIEIEFSKANNLSESEFNDALTEMKEKGYSDRQLAFLLNRSLVFEIIANEFKSVAERRKQVLHLLKEKENQILNRRKKLNLRPVYRRIDTCAAANPTDVAYLYSEYEELDESLIADKKKVMILGGGPNRIGQGIEFDYCCCHAAFALEEMGIHSVMVNSNPETVSTDYNTSDVLYFEPLTIEDVLHICENEKPWGVIVQFGGQTPLKLAQDLAKAGIPIIGTSPDSIDRAEDRDLFSRMIEKLGLLQPPNAIAHDIDEAIQKSNSIGYPCLVRPSYVLGGRAMAIVHDKAQLLEYMKEAESINPEHPVLIDRFLENAIEIDVDTLSDGKDIYVAGIMRHIEEAGVHSGDSACALPPINLAESMIQEIEQAATKLARELNVIGLMNIQFAIQNNKLYVIEVNPRASRTIPFVSKATGVPLAKLATKIMCGQKLKDLLPNKPKLSGFSSVKEVVLPFSRFTGADIILGPEMKSTGEVMGIAPTFEEAYLKAILAAGEKIPKPGSGVFFSVSDDAKPHLIEEARALSAMGYKIYGTQGTHDFLRKYNIEISPLHKLRDKQSPNPLDGIKESKIQVIINIPDSRQTRDDAFLIRQEAIRHHILCITTPEGAKAFVNGLQKMKDMSFSVHSLQEIHANQV